MSLKMKAIKEKIAKVFCCGVSPCDLKDAKIPTEKETKKLLQSETSVTSCADPIDTRADPNERVKPSMGSKASSLQWSDDNVFGTR